MSSVLVPQQTQQGWIIRMPPEMARTVGVAEGSVIVLHTREGTIETEILPPLAPELKDISRRIMAENMELFEELKRIGD
ncbi:MAG: hypothetical protein ACKV2V_29195 [Blastocatellia bacterium]